MEKIFNKIFNGEALSGTEQRILYDNIGEYDSDFYETNSRRELVIVYEVIYKIDNRFFRGYYTWNGANVLFDEDVLEEVKPKEKIVTEWVPVKRGFLSLKEKEKNRNYNDKQI